MVQFSSIESKKSNPTIESRRCYIEDTKYKSHYEKRQGPIEKVEQGAKKKVRVAFKSEILK